MRMSAIALSISGCLLVASLSCGAPSEPEYVVTQPAFAREPLTLLPLRTTDTYRLWWAEVEACTGRSRPIEQVEFFEVLRPIQGTQFPCMDERRWCSGAYADSKIYLAAGLTGTERFAKHEMLHAIFLGGGSHESTIFLECT